MHFVFACGLKHDEDADVEDLYKLREYHRGRVLQLRIPTDVEEN